PRPPPRSPLFPYTTLFRSSGSGTELSGEATWTETNLPAANTPPAYAGGSDWITGRAGMEYRDLIPGRLGGKVIASHIRLTTGGEDRKSTRLNSSHDQISYA